MWRILQNERGSAGIEFAGASLVFAMVLVFLIQAGAMMVTQGAAANAAREGARAAVTVPPSDPVLAVRRAAPSYDPRVAVQSNSDSVTVVVQLDTPVLFSTVAKWNWTVQGAATMRRER